MKECKRTSGVTFIEYEYRFKCKCRHEVFFHTMYKISKEEINRMKAEDCGRCKYQKLMEG